MTSTTDKNEILNHPAVKLRISVLSMVEGLVRASGIDDQIESFRGRGNDWAAYNVKPALTGDEYSVREGAVRITKKNGSTISKSNIDALETIKTMLAEAGIESDITSRNTTGSLSEHNQTVELSIDLEQDGLADKLKKLYELNKDKITAASGKDIEAGLKGLLHDDVIGRVNSAIEEGIRRQPRDADGQFMDPKAAKALIVESIGAINEAAKAAGINTAVGRAKG